MIASVVGNDWSWNSRTLSDLRVSVEKDSRLVNICETFFDFTTPTAGSEIFFTNEPDTLRISYCKDLNLVLIHRAFREKIIFILKNLNKIPLELFSLDRKLSSSSIAPIDIKELNKRKRESEEYLQTYSNIIESWERYKQFAIPILDEYTPLMSNEFKVGSVLSSSSFLDESQIEQRIILIERYIRVINKIGIIKIIAHKQREFKIRCPGCYRELETESSNRESNKISCDCGFSEDTIKHISEYQDESKITHQVNSTAINIKDFILFIDRFLCKSGEDFPKLDMWNKFDNFCIVANLPLRNNVLKKIVPQPPMQVIISLLQNTGYSTYYCIKNQIRYEYYGWEKPTMTEIEIASACKLYVDFQFKYLAKKLRKTNLNKDLLGFVILTIVGVVVEPGDFKIPASPEAIAYSNQMIMEIMPELGVHLSKIPDIRYMCN